MLEYSVFCLSNSTSTDLILMGNFFLIFLNTIDGQQSNLVSCHNDNLAYSTIRPPNYFKCVLNCDCYVPCYASTCCLLVLGTLGAILIAQWAQ